MEWRDYIPPDLTEQLQESQCKALNFAFASKAAAASSSSRIVLNLEMGMGKSLLSLCWFACLRSHWIENTTRLLQVTFVQSEQIVQSILQYSEPTLLILTPKATIVSWKLEFAKWWPLLTATAAALVLLCKRPPSNKKAAKNKRKLNPGNVHLIQQYENPTIPIFASIVIMSYDKLRTCGVVQGLRACALFAVLCDECQLLKTWTSQRTTVAVSLIKTISHLCALTGTLMDRPRDLFTWVHLCAPQTFPTFYAFAERYCGPRNRRVSQNCVVREYNGSSHVDELQGLLRPFLLRMTRRRTEDMVHEPEVHRTYLRLELDPLSPEGREILASQKMLNESHDALEARDAEWNAMTPAARVTVLNAGEVGGASRVAELDGERRVSHCLMSRALLRTAILKFTSKRWNFFCERFCRHLRAADGKILILVHHRPLFAILRGIAEEALRRVYPGGGTEVLQLDGTTLQNLQTVSTSVERFQNQNYTTGPLVLLLALEAGLVA